VTAAILSFGRPQAHSAPLAPKMPWQNQDLAELYRVRDRLVAAGLAVEVEGGVSDEGDPWFVYQQAGTDTVVVHIARIDTEIHVINCVTGNLYIGLSFREVSDRMLEDAPLALGSQLRKSSNVVLHPSAFLTAFVAAAILLVDLIDHGKVHAAELDDDAYALGDDEAAGLTLISSKKSNNSLQEPDLAHEGSAYDHQVIGYGNEPELTHRRIQKDGVNGSTGGAAPVQTTNPAASSFFSANHSGLSLDGPGMGLAAGLGLSASLFAAGLFRVLHNEGEGQANVEGDTWSELSGLLKFSSDEVEVSASGSGLNDEVIAPATAISSGPNRFDAIGAINGVIDATEGSLRGLAHINAFESTVHPPIRSGQHAERNGGSLAMKPAAPNNEGDGAVASSDDLPSATVNDFPPNNGPQRAPYSAAASAQFAAAAADVSMDVTLSAAIVPSSSSATVASPSARSSSESAEVKSLDLSWVATQLTHPSANIDSSANTTETIDEMRVDSIAVGSADSSKGAASQIILEGGAAGAQDKDSDISVPVEAVDSDRPSDLISEGVDQPTQLTMGRADTVVYQAGTNLVLDGFILGEDALSFSDVATADRLLARVVSDGNDLLLGDSTYGEIRLVGVLADQSALTQHMSEVSVAA
jgi:hypothetical protein